MVSRELEAIVLDSNMEELLKILEKKQVLVSKLEILADLWRQHLSELNIDETYGTAVFWEELTALFPLNDAKKFNRLLEENRAAAGDVMKAEELAQRELEKHLEELREKMRSMSKGREAFIGYSKMGGAQRDDF